MTDIRVKFINGHEAYGIQNRRAGFMWDLRIQWYFNSLPGDTSTWSPASTSWPATFPKSINSVVGWLFQNVKTEFRPANSKIWQPDKTDQDYWEMWIVVNKPAGIALPFMLMDLIQWNPNLLDDSAHNDTFCIGEAQLKALGEISTVLKKTAWVYFMPFNEKNKKAVDQWLNNAKFGNIGGAGHLPMSTTKPGNLPQHGLKRVTAIKRIVEKPYVVKWNDLKEPQTDYK